MADSAVVVTAGTGTNIDTRTEATNGNHRQVVVLGDPATNAGVAPVDATAGLKVDLGADNDITGIVTANAGTNLNTSALALEAGGNLATIASKDFATQTTLALIKAKTDNLDTALSGIKTGTDKIVTAKTDDFDTGAGTDTVQMLGLALPKSGGAVAGGTATDPIRTDPTGTTTQPVSAASLPLPTGAATSAKQDTLLTELQLKADLTETQPVSLASVPSHAVTNAGTFAVQASEADGANVTLGAKTDAKSTATDATAITAMQVLKQISASVQAPPTQAVTFTGSTDVATQTTLALIKAKTDNLDVLLSTRTKPADAQHAIVDSGAITETNSGGIQTSVQLIDDVIYTSGDALSKTAGIAAQFDDVTPGAVTENKMAPVRMSSRREMYSQIRDAAGNERGLNVDANGAIAATVTNVTAANLNMTEASAAAIKTSVELIDNAISGAGFNITQLGGAAVPIGAGLEATALRVTLPTDGTGVVKLGTGAAAIGKLAANSGVDIGDVDVATIAGIAPAFNAGAAGATVQRVVLATDTTVPNVTGNIANDGIDSGNPVKIGGKAFSTAPTAVAAADRVDAWLDLMGRQSVIQKSPTAVTTAVASSATSVTILAANTARTGGSIENDSTAILYLNLSSDGEAASTTDRTIALAGASAVPYEYFEIPAGYTGSIQGIWASANGSARVTEYS